MTTWDGARRRHLAGAVALLSLTAWSGMATAAEVYNKGGVLLNLNSEITAFGAAINEDFRPKNDDEVTWTEGSAKLGLSTEIDIAKDWKVFGTITGIGIGTGGEGDAAGFAVGGDGRFSLYEGFGGIKYQAGEKGPGFKLSGGRQTVKIADGFLIGADVPTGGSGFGKQFDEGGGYYLNARKTFGNTAVLNVETGTPLRFDAYWLQSSKDLQGDVEVGGGNVEWVDAKWGKVGFMYTRILETDPKPLFFAARQDDTNMFTVHGSTSLGIPDFELAGNYTRQERDKDGVTPEVDAYGYFASATYKFSKVKWTPEVMYRYSAFSGDDPNTAALEGYDPLFFGSTRWGTWFQGEIAANYSGPFSSNNDVHQVRLTVNPNDRLVLGAIVNRFSIDEPATYGNVIASSDFGTELDLYADITINKNLYLSPLYGAFFPGKGYEQNWNKDDTVHYFQLLAIYTY